VPGRRNTERVGARASGAGAGAAAPKTSGVFTELSEEQPGESLLEGRPVGARCAQTAPVLLLSFGMRAVRWHSSGVSWCQRLCEQLGERRKADAQGSEPASPERGGRRGQRAGAATSCEVGA